MTALVDAWQAALAAEHRAVFGYSLLGARLRGTAQLTLAVACSDAHEQLRDATVEAIAAAGLDPVPADADYPDLYPVGGPDTARSLAVRLEDECAAAWRYLYAVAATTAGTTTFSAPDNPFLSPPTGSGTRASTSRPPASPSTSTALPSAAHPAAAPSPGGIRGSAQTALTASAVRGVRWRGLVSPGAASVAFPGL
jgi:hypothetical protein